jgi:hypothetical protein
MDRLDEDSWIRYTNTANRAMSRGGYWDCDVYPRVPTERPRRWVGEHAMSGGDVRWILEIGR